MDDHSELGQLKSKVEALEAQVKKLEGLISRQDWPRSEDVDKYFLRLFEIFDNYSLQLLIRELGLKTWAYAALGLPLQQLARIRSCVSVNAWPLFVDYARESKFMSDTKHWRKEILQHTYRDWQCGMIETTLEDSFFPKDPEFSVPIKFGEPTDPELAVAYQLEKEAVREWKEKTLLEVEQVPREATPIRFKLGSAAAL